MPGTRTALSVVVVAAAVLAGSLGAAGAAAAEGAPSDRPVPGGQPTALLVKTAPAVDVAQLASEVGGVHTGRVGTSGVQRLSVPPSRIDGARRALAARPDVVGVEIDHVVTAARVPNDPFFPSQWGTVKVGAPDAWDVTIGTASTVVAVLDTGVSPQSDLPVLPGYDFVNRDADPADDHGHGTSAASIIAAQFDNGLAMSGVCGRCAVLPVKVLGRDGSGSYSAIISGIDYAVAQGADVLNLSLTGDVYSSFLADAVANARARGVVVVASAGNAGQTAMTYPAGLPGVLAVGATDEADRRTSYSNHGSWVTVAAPGRNVALNHVGDGVWFTGTSSSAPVVAGVVGLLRSHAPGASGAAVENAVTSSAVPIGSWVKHGRIDAVGALRALDSSLAFRPSAPTGVGGTAGDGAVQVSWTAAADRGSAITRYSVTSLPGGRTCATSGAVTCTVAGLTNGTAYTFSVTASNAVGTSDASSASAAVTPVAAVAPAAPAAPTATAGDGSAAVSWTAPADGGSPITGYTVTSSPDGKSCTTTGALSCVVGRLTNGTAYTFTVTATNAVGTSPASASSSAVTPVAPATAPAAPAAPTATAGDGSAAVSWTAPADGGSPITAYTATSRPQGKTCTTSGVTSCTVSGLANSTAYTFTVTATNAVGTSPASAPSNTVTPIGPATAPAAPAAPTATAGDGSAAVSWTAPADGGSPITGYTVASSPGGKSCTTTSATSCTVSGLTNGTAYTFTVTATNGVGTSPASAPSGSVTPVAPVVDRVAVVGTDDALWVRRSDSTSWGRLGGTLIDTPAVAVNGSTTYYVVLGSDRNVWVRTDRLNWQPLGPAGTNCASPSAAVSKGTLAVGCTGSDNALWVSKTALPASGLPKLPGWSPMGGILKTGPSLSDASTTSTPAFGYTVLGADSRPWFLADGGTWAMRSSALCGGVVASSQRAEALACKDDASASLKTFHAPSQPGATLLAPKIVNGSIQGRSAVTAGPDGSARYYVLGTDGTIRTATQRPDGTLTGLTLWGGAGKHGIGATSLG